MDTNYKTLQPQPIHGSRRVGQACLGWTAVLGCLVVLSCSQRIHSARVQAAEELTFASPEEAADALVTAVQNEDETKSLSILGVSKEIVSTGDEVRDKRERQQFVDEYRQTHQIARAPDGTAILQVGSENWPFPFPLVSKAERWYFDPDAGAAEMFFRKIGENETKAITACRSLAQKLPQLTGEPPTVDGYRFRVVPGTGATARVIVAYPAEYRSSGVMTFLATPDGKVYEQDLGPYTDKLAGSTQPWMPDVYWHLIDSAVAGSN